METINLLDLDNDILNVIGDYVKKDNHDREFQEYMRMRKIETNAINLFKIIKNFRWKKHMRQFIINYFYINSITNIETIDIYLSLMKLNLKRKKYTFSKYCIDNLQDSKKTYDEILEQNTLRFYLRDNNIFCMHYIHRFLSR
jgi:hypothetical protein